MNKTVSIVTIVMLLFVVFFAGCVGKEQTQVVTPTSTQVVTPTPTLSPTPTDTTLIPTPISTPGQVAVTDRVRNLGQPVKGKSNVWALITGLDGNIYGGTGEGGTLFVYDPNTSTSKQIEEVFEEDAVYSLATDENGSIYGGTAWNSKLFIYYPHNKSISYLGQPVTNGGIICSLTVIGSNVYGSTCDGGDSKYVGSHLFVYNSTVRNFTDLGQPVEGERSSKITSGKDGKIYGGTSPNGYLFSYDPWNKSFNNIGQPVHEEATAFPLIAGKNDKIYFSLDESLYMLDPVQSRIIKLFNLSDFIPLTGEFFWSLAGGLDGNIYGGTAPNGYLFAYNTSDNSIAAGRPLESEYRIRSLNTGLDGKIYGGTGGGAYLFSYDPYNKTSMEQVQIISIPIKAGYTLYQNNEYNYGFGYPNNWEKSDRFGLTGSILQGVGISHEYKNPQTGIISYPGMMVVVCSDDMFSPANLSKTYYIRSTKNTTVNGRKAIDIVATLSPAALGDHPENNVGMRWIIIQANGYFYVMNFYAGDIYTVNSDMYNDMVNSWVIGNISQ